VNDLNDQINNLMEGGIRPVCAAEVTERRAPAGSAFPASAHRRRLPSRRVAVITGGLAAAACAVALVASQAGGTVTPAAAKHQAKAPAVLTAAFVNHLARASKLALAHSGQAVISSRQTLAGKFQQTAIDNITFDGANWNDSFSERLPGSHHSGGTQSAINRVVRGQAYDYFVAADGLAWYHDTGANAVHSMHLPDPRKLLAELAPAAGFVKVGATTLHGVKVEHLRATTLSGLPSVELPQQWNTGKVVGLNVWVDTKGVVRKLRLVTSQTLYPGTITRAQLLKLPKTMKVVGWRYIGKQPGDRAFVSARKTATGQVTLVLHPGTSTAKVLRTATVVHFLHIGQHLVIRVPAHAIPTAGQG
jgi:hypothetical protein